MHQRGAQLLAASSGCSLQPVPKAPERRSARKCAACQPGRPLWGKSARPAGPGGAALQPLEQLVCHTFPGSSKGFCSALHVVSAGVPAARGGDRARCSLHVAAHTVTVCMSRPPTPPNAARIFFWRRTSHVHEPAQPLPNTAASSTHDHLWPGAGVQVDLRVDTVARDVGRSTRVPTTSDAV